MLLFKKKFLEAIRQGEKTQTIRLWKQARLKAGQRSYIPGVGYIRIVSVQRVELSELTDADARPDGFATADALRNEIKAIYAQSADGGQKAYRICFRLAPEERSKRTTPARRVSPLPTASLVPASESAAQPQDAVSALRPAVAGAKSRLLLPADGFQLGQSRSI